jgi:hypothetical protein
MVGKITPPRPWTSEERTKLRAMWAAGYGPVSIGRELGRSKYSIRSEVETLDLGPRGGTNGPPAAPPPVVKIRPRPLAPGTRTLPLLPSEGGDA